MNGILQNPLYSGKRVWNRVRMVKDPRTGRRVSRANPEKEWTWIDLPELRIVPQDLFDTVHKLKNARGNQSPHHSRKPRHPFSGLLKCGSCGAGMSVKDTDHGRRRVICTQFKEAASCSNKKPYYLDEIEKTVLSGLKAELRKPEAIRQFVQSYNEEMKRLASSSSSALHKKKQRHAKVEGEIQRIIDAVAKGVLEHDDVRERLPRLKTERDALQQEIDQIEMSKAPIALHPTAITSYLDSVERLEQVIRGNPLQGNEESKTALRKLVDSILIHAPDTEGRGMRIEVRGYMSRLVGGDLFPQRSFQGGMVVAEEGLEPPTRGL
jgi:site-specific DNA recombinase